MERYQENSRRTRRVQDAQTVLGFLTNRFNTPVFPAMSDHYHEPDTHVPSPIVVEDSQLGFDSEGNYHCPSLRTEHIERPVQLDGTWEL